MESTPKTTEELWAEDGLKNVPSEVVDFMTSPLYEVIISAAQQALSLTAEQKNWMRLLSYELLMTTITEKGAYQFLIDHSVSAETAIKILYVIDTEILTRAENITEFFTDDSEVTDEEVASYAAPKPVNFAPTSLQSLADRLKQPSFSANTSHSYIPAQGTVPANLPVTELILTPDTAADAPVAPASNPIKTIDPYHEPIEK
ncbi:MAG: hypothetical protein JWL92_101 [Candidatus Nomurabacteria bacterium]|nr:hypothetical protein [Candidatus Nomurabacteria bacterium]